MQCVFFIFTVNIWFFVVVSSTFHSLPHTIQKSSGHVIYVRGWNEFWPHLQAIDRCPFQAFLRMLLKSHERVAEKMASSKAGHTGMIFAHKIQPQEMRPQSWKILPYDGCISLERFRIPFLKGIWPRFRLLLRYNLSSKSEVEFHCWFFEWSIFWERPGCCKSK